MYLFEIILGMEEVVLLLNCKILFYFFTTEIHEKYLSVTSIYNLSSTHE